MFAVYNLGFVARSARENDDAGEPRLTKIERIIEQCKYGIHDLSAVELDATTHLPRFNMPLELGLFLGCRRYGEAHQKGKLSVVLDREPCRYREFISDISGQDIHAHNGDPERAVLEVRNWLQASSKRKGLAGGTKIIRHYSRFRKGLPSICEDARLDPDHLTFIDFSRLVVDWLRANR